MWYSTALQHLWLLYLETCAIIMRKQENNWKKWWIIWMCLPRELRQMEKHIDRWKIQIIDTGVIFQSVCNPYFKNEVKNNMIAIRTTWLNYWRFWRIIIGTSERKWKYKIWKKTKMYDVSFFTLFTLFRFRGVHTTDILFKLDILFKFRCLLMLNAE